MSQIVNQIMVIPFSRPYSKLFRPVFTTIRRHDKGWEVGQQLKVIIKKIGVIGYVEVISKHFRTFPQLDTKCLMKDTDGISRENSIQIIQSFYRNPIENYENLVILVLLWEKPPKLERFY